ncbi:MAG: DUF2281 domain-containing protein [Methylobacter sp.]|nr:DUF2281 domain-containing protein [Methylobacter sp.]
MPIVDLSTLPANAQQELLDFYEFLQEKYAGRKASPVALTQQPAQTDFKTFILNIPKMEGIEFERQHDYPKDIVL